MDKTGYAILIMTCLVFSSTAIAQEPKTALKGDFRYQFATSEGYRVNLLGGGISAERHVSRYNITLGLTANYFSRTDEIVDTALTLDDVWYFSLGLRYYYGKALSGMYVGFVGGLGLPANEGVYRDICYQLGYQFIHGRLLLDLNTQIGLAGYDIREYTPEYDILYAFSGFVLKAGISAGIGF